MGRGVKNTMGRGVKIPWVGKGQNTMGSGVKISWVWGSKYHG